MRKLLLFFSLLCSTAMVAQSISGKVVDGSNGDPLIGASISVGGTSTGALTDVDGMFKIDGLTAGSYTLIASYLGYEEKSISVEVGSGNVDLGEISLNAGGVNLESVVITGVMDIVDDRKTPVAVSTINIREIQAKSVGNVEFPMVMKNTPSVYVSNQTGFGDAQMFLRGFDQRNTAFLLNGQPINGMEDGRMYWSNWSMMSDVASAVQIQRGLGSSKLAISSVGGTVNIVTKATDLEAGGYGRLMMGNDGYLKGTIAYNSGLKGKWAYSLLIDHWQADNKWADGTKGQGQSYFLSVGFKPNESHSFNFLVVGAPQWHGQRWSQSLDRLEEQPKFNQHWGSDQGEWESERRNFYHKPVLNLNWDWSINEKSSLSSVLYASIGRGGGTGPFGSSSNRVRTAEGQVDFDAIRANNLQDPDGLGSFSGNYAIRASMNNHLWYGNVTNYKTQLTDEINWSVGTDIRFYTGTHFRQFANLLGLDGWQDNFRHSTRPGDAIQSETFSPDPWTALFSFADEDQRIAYDYSEDINYQGLFTQLEYADDDFSTFVQGAISTQSYQREGRWADQGKSEKVNKVGYNVKAGASYAVNEGGVLFANAGLYSRQPFLDNVFSNVRYSNELVTTGDGEGVSNEEIVGFELGYKYSNGNFDFNVNAYSTSWGNRTDVDVFTSENGTPDDESDDFTVRQVQRGLSQKHTGVELDLAYRVSDLRINGFASIGNWTYQGVDNVQTFNDDTGVLLSEEEGLDNDGVHVPNSPQTSFGIGLDYKIVDGLNAYLDFNYYDRLYRNDINFDDSFILEEDIGTLDAYELFNFGLGYTFDLGENFMTLRANVYNLFDKTYINQTDPFGYLNGNGRTWNVSAKYSF